MARCGARLPPLGPRVRYGLLLWTLAGFAVAGPTPAVSAPRSASLSASAPFTDVAAPDTAWVHCSVFLDSDEDGERDGGEPVLPGVRLTNGLDVFHTGPTGDAAVPVDRAFYRFATVTVPAGFWPTTPFWHWMPVGHAGPDTVAFGLRSFPRTSSGSVRWAHITDTHANAIGVPPRFTDALDQIEQITEAPVCIFNTGDLVEAGGDPANWVSYMSQIAVSPVPVLHVMGNHETTPTDPLGPFEMWVGAPYYSLEMGSWHFVVWNSEPGSPRQHEWLVNDLAASPPGLHVALLQHRMAADVADSTVALWSSLGIGPVFSGHWHGTQITARSSGLVDYTACWTVFGPIDRTARGFGLVTCREDGEVFYDLRRLGVDHRAFLVSPAHADTVVGTSVPVVLQLYDTSVDVAAASVRVTGPGGAAIDVPLTRQGISHWRGDLDLSGRPAGTYVADATGHFEDGRGFGAQAKFLAVPGPCPPPALGADWPMFRRCPAGSSFVAQPLEPPLRLLWSAPTAGMTGLSSPVVAEGKVLFGVRAEQRPEDAGVAAFDALTGTLLWNTSLPGGVALAPAVAGNVVIVNALADSVYGLDVATGARRWARTKDYAGFDQTAPIVDGPSTWIGSAPRLFQLRWTDGFLEWGSPWRGPGFYPYVYGAPAVDATSVYAGGFAQDYWIGSAPLAAFRRSDGAMQVWADHGAWRSPICVADTLYVVGGDTGMTYNPVQYLSRRRTDGSTSWTTPQNLMKETASPALAYGILVTSGRPMEEDGRIHGFDAADGTLLWSFGPDVELYDMTFGKRQVKSTSSSPAIADDVVYVGSLDGHLYALDLFTGEELWRFFLGTPVASSPAVSGDLLFVGASDGHLWAFARREPVGDVGVDGRPDTGTDLQLHLPAPNPGGPGTRFVWEMPRRGRVTLKLYDLGGRLVRRLVDEVAEAGRHEIAWDGKDDRGVLAVAGVYFVRLESGDRRIGRRCVHLR